MNDVNLSNMPLGGQFDQEVAISLLKQAGAVIAILVVTWIIARIAKWSFAKLVDKVPLFQRAGGSGDSVGASLGRIVSLFIWLFGLIAVLQALHLNSVIGPVQSLLDNFIGFIPKIVGAAIMFFVGTMIARIVRDIVQTTLSTVSFDKWANLGGAQAVTGNATISKTISTVVFILIVIPVGIAALDILNIPSITVPAKNMLTLVLQSVPLIIGASLLLGLGYFIARWVSGMIEEVLPGLGFDQAVSSIGVLPAGRSASSIVAAVVNIAIMLFMAVAATRLLGFPELTRIVSTVLDQGASVVFGAVLIAVGVLLARVIKGLIGSAAGEGMAPNLIYWLTVALFVFIGLKQMNIGGNIVDYAFGAISAGAAIAFAIAFGLGGRDAAAKALGDLTKK